MGQVQDQVYSPICCLLIHITGIVRSMCMTKRYIKLALYVPPFIKFLSFPYSFLSAVLAELFCKNKLEPSYPRLIQNAAMPLALHSRIAA